MQFTGNMVLTGRFLCFHHHTLLMNDEFYLQQLQDADEVVVTPHALERGYDESEIRDLVRHLQGTVYLDTDEQAYHIVTADTVVLVKVRNGKRIVVTAYPNDEPSRYHSIQYRLLRG